MSSDKNNTSEGPDNVLLREVIERRLGEQISSVDTFATRAGLVLATCGVAFAGYAQLLTSSIWLQSCGAILFVPEISLVVASGFFAFAALSIGGEVGSWAYDPDPEKLYRLAHERSRVQIEDDIVRSMVDAYNRNRKTFKKKFDLLRYARYALYGSGAVFLLHLVIFFY
jgi:hypothetical protein